ETSRCGLRAVVRLDVDQCRYTGFECALECRTDLSRIFNILAITAERFGHFFESRIAELAARLLALFVSSPTSVQTNHRDHGNFEARRRIELHRVEAERTIPVQYQHLLVWPRDLRAYAKR